MLYYRNSLSRFRSLYSTHLFLMMLLRLRLVYYNQFIGLFISRFLLGGLLLSTRRQQITLLYYLRLRSSRQSGGRLPILLRLVR
jgi:hypothetical protein